MALIGISEDEARHLVSKMGALTDELRSHVRNIQNHVDSLTASYVSDTTVALRGKWEGETRPQFEKLAARHEEAQAGTTKAVAHQMSTQGSGAGAIQAI